MAESMKEQVLSYIKTTRSGATAENIKEELPTIDLSNIVIICNQLLNEDLVTVHVNKNSGTTVFKANVLAMKNADNEEKVIFQLVQASGNKGISPPDIKKRTNLLAAQINKSLKKLENERLIKSVPVKASRKKMYMLYDLIPDTLLTGGVWYSNEGFDSDFVDAITAQCERFLDIKRENAKKLVGGPLIVNNNSYASVAEVCEFINNLNLTTIHLASEELEQILRTLCLDDKVERKMSADGNHLFKAIKSLPPPGFVQSPCGICPVYKNCDLSTSYNPKSCTYLKDWLF